MLSRVNAMIPAPKNKSSPSSTIGRRVSPNVISALSTGGSLCVAASSAVRRRERVAQEQRAFRGDELARPQAVEDLNVAGMPQPHRDGPLDETLAVGGDPDRHRAVTLAHDAVIRDRGGAHRIAGADHEI